MMRLDQRVTIITGGASGIGQQTACRCAEEGARVVIWDLNEPGAVQVSKRITAKGQVADYRLVDVSSEEKIAAGVGEVMDRYGQIDVLFNNAAIGFSSGDRYAMAPVVDTPREDWDAVLAINLRSVYLTCKYVLPIMQEQGAGSIINNSSVMALTGTHGADAYTAAKGGIIALSRSIAKDYAPYGVRVNCICPGAIRTPIQGKNENNPAFDAEMSQIIPLRRIGEPIEVANLVLFLASDEASYITGAVIPVDGGWTI